MPRHIDSAGNEETEKLVKNALTSGILYNYTLMSHNYLYPIIKTEFGKSGKPHGKASVYYEIK